jgi:tetratricopeptide (TPR) repeat protein
MIEPIKHENYTIDDVHVSVYEYPEQTENSTSSGNSSRARFRRMRTETTSPTFQWSESSETTSSDNTIEMKGKILIDELISALENRDYESAIRVYDQLEALIPLDQEEDSIAILVKDFFLLLKGCCYGLLDHPKQALSICESIEDHSTFDEMIHSYRGFFHLLDGDLEKGLSEFRSIENPYDHGNTVLLLVLLEKRLGVSLFNPEIEYRTLESDEVLDTEEGLKYLAQGRYREAIENFDPRWDEDMAYAAFCHAMLGEWDEYAFKIEQAKPFAKDEICFVNVVLSLLKRDLEKADAELSRMGYYKAFECDPRLLLAMRYFEKNR